MKELVRLLIVMRNNLEYYFEEEDLYTRAQLIGFKIGYTESARIRHYVSPKGKHRNRF